ncbi:MAG: hypothetical protein AB7F66_13080 [Bacteriovoracia bacterium]
MKTLMKTKIYRNGKLVCKAYQKPAGMGWEVGFTFDGKNIFVGNFIHSSEANTWYRLMNHEVRGFSRRYKVGRTFPKSWFGNFLATHLYKTYYNYLDRVFTKYQRGFTTDFSRNVRRYQKLNRGWQGIEKKTLLKAA